MAEAAAPARIAVIAIGNALRGDDRACLDVATRVRAHGIPVHVHGDDMLALLDAWAGSRAAVLLDTVESGAPAGTIVRVEVTDERPLKTSPATSTHALSLGEVIELARALGALPSRLIVFGIEGARLGVGEDLSPHVRDAIEPLATAVVREVSALQEDVMTGER